MVRITSVFLAATIALLNLACGPESPLRDSMMAQGETMGCGGGSGCTGGEDDPPPPTEPDAGASTGTVTFRLTNGTTRQSTVYIAAGGSAANVTVAHNYYVDIGQTVDTAEKVTAPVGAIVPVHVEARVDGLWPKSADITVPVAYSPTRCTVWITESQGEALISLMCSL